MGDIEPFHPERMASRILGMGDVLTLIERAQEAYTEEEAKAANFSDPDAPVSLPPEENLNALLRTVPEGEISAEIRDDTLRVSLSCSGEAVKPVRIEFAELPYYEINVKNGAGLPVFPFTLESRL